MSWDWEPAGVAEVVGLFGGLDVPWWVAGGHAVELFVGRSVREHGDIDVLLLRRDQLAVQRALAGWEWWAADPPGRLRRWSPGEVLPVGVHDVWCRPAADRPWRVQVMLDEADGDDWVSRRDPLVRRPVAELGLVRGGVPCLAPEVQLFYKAAARRAKDEVDFAVVAPLLSAERRAWLDGVLPPGHPWRSAGG